MSEEEIKSIEHLERFMERIRTEKYLPEAEIALDTSIEDVLYLIDKQQKEIECLNVIHESYKEMIEENNYISKDKIRETIKELEQIQNTALTGTTVEIMDYKITILKQLLEE